MDSSFFPAKVLTFFQGWKSRRRNFNILAIGDCGSGKTTLVNNLLGEQIAQDHAPSILSTFHGVFQGVPVTVHETSGLENPDAENDAGYMNELRALLSGGEVDVIIYCFKATETRMRESFVHSLQEYHSMGLDWRKTVIALTFADVLPISKSGRQNRSYDQARYFDSQVAEWKKMITQTLTNKIGVPIEGLKLAPVTGDPIEELPNHERWSGPMWSLVLDAIKAAPSSSLRRNIMPDRQTSSSQPRRTQHPPRSEGISSQDKLHKPSFQQRENEACCSAECVCSCFGAVLVGIFGCIMACYRVIASVFEFAYHACCKRGP